MSQELFSASTAGAIELKNRIVMAPLTRNRADDQTGEVLDRHVEYYAQRAGAGLIITEGSQISPEGKGYIQTPGIHTAAQAAAWRKVTDAVHAKGGKIVIQLWHVGRITHDSLLPGGTHAVSSTDAAAEAQTFTHNGFEPTAKPQALSAEGIQRVVADYVQAAKYAKDAGFDGIELHAANGYLLEQFLKDGVNTRTDAYGGSPENRARIVFEILDGLLTVWDAGRIGLRLSPFATFNDVLDSDPVELYTPLIQRLNSYGLAYLHMVEGNPGGAREGDFEALRKIYTGTYMANNGYDRATALARTASGEADLVAFGRPFISNPDLVDRLAADAPLNEGNPETFYGGGDEGYTDYPVLEQVAAE
ncbi:alkene reductase [Leisingera sp. ANG-M6]|uniref:alkene reductase n=1 Tax=Leisingera sp. ANG-M6 TaxID=1577900 RepID=UPI000580A7C9|nr:alkene reductase [Leisingera sp. ANG-M6]KIC29862.1 NADH:flavin oxidoreductase [Leisingera sp. ANG-M6]